MSIERILVPTDFSECGNSAIEKACGLAEKCHAKLYLLHVGRPVLEETDEKGRLRVELEKLNTLVSAKSELSLETVKDVVVGGAAQSITRYAKEHDVDMIVMGTHGRSGLAHLALGSVAERVLRTAPCPVMVVRPESEATTEMLTMAASALSRKFGDSLQGTWDETTAQFSDTLQTSLDVPKTTADRLIETLQRREWIQWTIADSESIGQWRISIAKGIFESPPPLSTNYADSPALDLIDRAQRLRATDIHIDPGIGPESSVRLRIDGRLEHYCQLDENVAEHLINRLKMLARLDISDPFHPKEGRLALPTSMSNLEVRITTAPVASGEAVALRIFSRENIFFPLDKLGLAGQSEETMDDILHRQEGLLLVTGPTGAGKSSTVYSILQSLSTDDQNVVSIEDPVEFAAPFVRQMGVDLRHDITMTTGLRTILRMDPDIIFVGEIRDALAAEIAMRAASSGKYVLSTLHARNVASSITALRDLGVADRSIAGNLMGVVNQRLVRRLCSSCKRPVGVSDEMKQIFEENEIAIPNTIFERNGCDVCRNTGYLGRIGLFESAVFTDQIEEIVAAGLPEHEIDRMIKENGIVSLQVDGYQKVADGIVDFQETQSVHWLT